MKKVKLKIQANLIDNFANYLIEKNFNVVMTWSIPEEFFSPLCVIVILALDELQELDITTGAWKQHLIK